VNVVHAGEADGAIDDIGVTRGEVRGVIGAEAGAVHSQVAALCPVKDVGHELVTEVGVVLRVTRRPNGGMDLPVVPALVVHGVDKDQLNLAAVDLVGQRVRHAAVLVLRVTPRGGRKEHHRAAEFAEPGEFHVPTERGAVPGDVFAVHENENPKCSMLNVEYLRLN